MNNFVSIIFTHFSNNELRSELMRKSILSLIDSLDYPAEIIAVDNGTKKEDSDFLLNLCHEKKINTYIRNSNNQHFGWARNQGIDLSHGDYVCIVDNDLEYAKGWLSKCIKVLEAFPDKKWYATPMRYPNCSRYVMGSIEFDNDVYKLDMRAGSNCFVIRKTDLDKIGHFQYHRIAGTVWTTAAVRSKYLAVVVPGFLVQDMGFHKGYNIKEVIPINLTLSDGTNINFNQDL